MAVRDADRFVTHQDSGEQPRFYAVANSLCFIGLILHRVMRMRLRAADTGTSPERALEQLSRIQRHQVYLGDTAHRGISTVDAQQSALLKALGAAKPTESKQLPLL